MLLRYAVLIYVLLSVLSCDRAKTDTAPPSELEKAELQLRSFDSLQQSEIMIVGTYHFDKRVLEEENQKEVLKLVNTLAAFKPTKVVIEWEPSLSNKTNQQYHSFLEDSFDISTSANEIYQVGFRIAKQAGNDSLYLFDDQTEFIGSLKDFSFASFAEYGKAHDDGFYTIYEKDIVNTYNHNEAIYDSLSLYNEIALRNSPTAQYFNRQRMHMYEIRVGIQKNWMGPDWVGRWYRRNLRMSSNVLRITENGDRILVIVGDNHKWTLDMLFDAMPDYRVLSTWDYLKKGHSQGQ